MSGPNSSRQSDEVVDENAISSTTSGSLHVNGVGKWYPRMDHAALEEVDFEVAAGKFFTLIGPSGCGKTTLLRIVAGLTAPTTGQVLIDGKPSHGPSREKSLVFQHFNLFPWRTALENVAYGLEMQKVPKNERLEKAHEYLRLVDLDRFAGHYPHELSGGMRQRVGIARGLAVEPKVLLMDEPFGALDALTRETLQIELERICAATSVTVLFVTHSIDEAVYLSDEVITMGISPGRVISRIAIDLPRPRWDYDARGTEEFGSVRSQIWKLLQKEMGRERETTMSGE